MTGADAWPVDGGTITFEFDAEILQQWVADFVPNDTDAYILTITYTRTRDEAESAALAWITLTSAARLEGLKTCQPEKPKARFAIIDGGRRP